jgi:hypothetical protein
MRHRRSHSASHMMMVMWIFSILGAISSAHVMYTSAHKYLAFSLTQFHFLAVVRKKYQPCHSTLNFEATADFFPSACGLLCDQRASHLSRRPAAVCSLSILSDRTFNCPERKNWCRRIYYTMPYTNRKTGLNYCDCREGDYKTHAVQLMSQKSLCSWWVAAWVIFLSLSLLWLRWRAAAALWCEVFALRKYCYYVNTSARLSLVKHWK